MPGKKMPSKNTRRISASAWLAVAGLVFLWPQNAYSQEGFRAWVGLYNPAHLGWLENENRITELCADAIALAECYAQNLGPRLSFYSLHQAPNASSPRLGEIIVVAVPGRALSAHFRPAGTSQLNSFTPDLFLQDWGYGPYFHQTVSAAQQNWFQLPMGPWEDAVWLHRESEAEQSSLIELRAGDFIEMAGSSFYVVDAEPDALDLRAEQPGDHWCEEGDPPPIEAVEPNSFTRADLIDSQGHLSFQLKYLKGC